MNSSEYHKRKLSEALKAEDLAKKVCKSCGGDGYIDDTTYDRCGIEVSCSKCYATGLPEEKLIEIVNKALKFYKKWPAVWMLLYGVKQIDLSVI